MTVTICLPTTELISIDAMASVDTAIWRCRLCGQHGTTTTRPTAHSEGIEHLSAEHHATIGITPRISSGRPPVERLPPSTQLPAAGRFRDVIGVSMRHGKHRARRQ